jgi:hypothetical protein
MRLTLNWLYPASHISSLPYETGQKGLQSIGVLCEISRAVVRVQRGSVRLQRSSDRVQRS